MHPAVRIGTSEGRLEVTSLTERAFSKVLTETGTQALLYHLEKEHGVSAADIVDRPADFVKALASIFGDYGSALLMKRVSDTAAISPF
jgi:hypothetical protein